MADIYDMLGLRHPLAGMVARNRPQPQTTPQLNADQAESLIQKLKGGGLSALATVGNVLGTPAHMGINLLAGENPLTPLAHPFSGEGRIGGRGLLHRYGLTTRNDPNKWEWADLGGFLTEVGLDPLTYATLGASALGKAGQTAKAAGLLDDAARAASLAGQGRRAFRMTNTLNDVIGGPAAASRAQAAAAGLGHDFSKIANQPLGGLIALQVPFMKSTRVSVGSGKLAQKVAGVMDRVGESARYGKLPYTDYSPGAHLHSLFNSRAGGMTTREGQQAAEELWHRSAAARAQISRPILESAQDLHAHGLTDMGSTSDLALAMEGFPMQSQASPQTDFIARAANEVHGMTDRQLARKQSIGMSTGRRLDRATELYAHRQFPDQFSVPPQLQPAGLGLAKRGSPDVAQRDFMKHWIGGRETINAMSRDPYLGGTGRAAVDDAAAAAHIRQSYGHLFVPETPVANPLDPTTFLTPKSTLRRSSNRMARFLGKLEPQHAAAGVFSNHPLEDALRGAHAAEDTIQGVHQVLNVLGRHSFEPGMAPKGIKTVTVGSVLKANGLKQGNPLKNEEGALIHVYAQRDRAGLAVPADPKDLAKFEIPQTIAADLGRMVQSTTTPEPVNRLVRGLDSATQFYKSNFLSWPSTKVRDWASGQVQNLLMGHVPLHRIIPANREAHTLLSGGVVPGAAQVPAVAAELKASGLPLTDAAATPIWRRQIADSDLIGHGQQSDLAMALQDAEPALNSVLKRIPGELPLQSPLTWRVMSEAIPRTRAEWNPLNIAGLNGRTETKFAPAKWSNTVGHYTDSMNRVVPVMEQMRRGVDAHSAARAIRESQVDYATRNFSQFERSAMTRMIPFYKFTRKMGEATLRELLQRPGGPTAQAIHAQAAASRDQGLLPEHIAGGTAIPLGTLPTGDKRFLTGFGLMHESTLPFLGGGVQGAGLQALSMLHPFLKGPLEYLTGKSFFQHGESGARNLEDLDPLAGRLLANLSGAKDPVKLPAGMEQFLSNSPYSRHLSSLRTFTDPRKRNSLAPGVPVPGLSGLANLLTGVRISDVSPRAQDVMLRERAQAAMKELGAKSYTKVYFPKDEIAGMPKPQQRAAVELHLLNSLIAERAKHEAAGGKSKLKKNPVFHF